jgi:acyl carrier protein
MSNDIKTRAAKVLSTALGRSFTPADDPKRSETPDWDSLKHIELILMLEAEFQIRFSGAEVTALRSLDDIVEKVRSKIGS